MELFINNMSVNQYCLCPILQFQRSDYFMLNAEAKTVLLSCFLIPFMA